MAEAHPAGHLENIGDQPEVSSFGMSLLPGNVCVLDPLEAGACVPGCLGRNVRMKFCRNVPTVVAPCMVHVLAGRTPGGDAWEEGNPQNWMLRPSDDYLSESLRAGLFYGRTALVRVCGEGRSSGVGRAGCEGGNSCRRCGLASKVGPHADTLSFQDTLSFTNLPPAIQHTASLSPISPKAA